MRMIRMFGRAANKEAVMTQIRIPSAYADAKLAFHETDDCLLEAIRSGDQATIKRLIPKWIEADRAVRIAA